MPATRHRLPLVIAGAFAVAAIGLATILAHKAAGPAFVALLLGAYALGLGAGRLAFIRRG